MFGRRLVAVHVMSGRIDRQMHRRRRVRPVGTVLAQQHAVLVPVVVVVVRVLVLIAHRLSHLIHVYRLYQMNF